MIRLQKSKEYDLYIQRKLSKNKHTDDPALNYCTNTVKYLSQMC